MAIRFLANYMKAQWEEILKHKWNLSEKAGKDVGLEFTLKHLERKRFFKKFREDYFKNNNITALDSEVDETLNGDSCLIFNFELIAHNHETNKDSVLERESLKYCLGNTENCKYRREESKGLYICQRSF